MDSVAGKVSVVTGASRGLGKAIALELAQAGARLACVATRAENTAGTVAEIKRQGGEALAFGCHVEVANEVTSLFGHVESELGPVDILVNNAGITRPQLTLEMTEENWNQHVDINMKSIFLCSQAAGRQMKENVGGCIVNIGSILGRNAFPATLGYCASKAAVDQMTRVMAIEWARFNIRVNCVASGYIESDMVDGLEDDGKLTVKDLIKRTPQRRLGSGTDIAKAVHFLASEDAGFITGEVLVVDGGWSAFGYYQTRSGR